MPCAEILRIEAWFDGEADASAAAALGRHVEQCAECRTALARLRGLRQVLGEALPRETAPPELRARIISALDEVGTESAGAPAAGRLTPWWLLRSFWTGALSGLGAAGLAATLLLIILPRMGSNRLLDDLAAAHVRSLQDSRLVAVVSTDRHTVKPWFAGRADVSPVVADFGAEGYRLLGGRVDRIQGQRAAVLAYQHGPHVINVFSWMAGGRSLPDESTRRGYRIACWTASDLGYCAVTDTDAAELHGLEQLMQALGH